ncbi:hypothetical protein ANN_06748 [Periplaneta americana]|uniref:Reverse transcriptase domain-containing protein n=1 Tax=Periplaneta americana TaxID=6978 RepID=A0ABQ8TGA5_PERAM|nr:hypothetical protein ANN_06748 [Periplaneta americana]
MSPGSSNESYPAFVDTELRENFGKNLNQVTCPDRVSNPGHLVSRPDAPTVTPQKWLCYASASLYSSYIWEGGIQQELHNEVASPLCHDWLFVPSEKDRHPAISSEHVVRVRKSFQPSPQKSLRKAIRPQLGILYQRVWKVLRKRLQMKPYKLQLQQKLIDHDKENSYRFTWSFQEFGEENGFMKRLIFSDVAIFLVSDGIRNNVSVPLLPRNLQQLRMRIREVAAIVTPDRLSRVCQELDYVTPSHSNEMKPGWREKQEGKIPLENTRLWRRPQWQPAEGAQQNRNDPKSFQVIITPRITTWAGGSSIDGIYSLPTFVTLFAPPCYGRCSQAASKSRDRVIERTHFLAEVSSTALLKVTEDIREAMDRGEVTALTLLDFSNAFGSVDIDLLLAKMKALHLSDNTLSWMDSFLRDRQQHAPSPTHTHSCTREIKKQGGSSREGCKWMSERGVKDKERVESYMRHHRR